MKKALKILQTNIETSTALLSSSRNSVTLNVDEYLVIIVQN